MYKLIGTTVPSKNFLSKQTIKRFGILSSTAWISWAIGAVIYCTSSENNCGSVKSVIITKETVTTCVSCTDAHWCMCEWTHHVTINMQYKKKLYMQRQHFVNFFAWCSTVFINRHSAEICGYTLTNRGEMYHLSASVSIKNDYHSSSHSLYIAVSKGCSAMHCTNLINILKF